MAAPSTLQAARLSLPDEIVRGEDTLLELRVYHAGEQLVPTACTAVVKRADGRTVSTGAATIDASGTCTYTVLGTATASQTLAESWRVEWSATIDGTTEAFYNEASLVRQKLRPMVTDADLYRRVPALDSTQNSAITSLANYQDFHDEAWTELMQRLISLGNRPALVMSPSALRQVLLLLTLAVIFEGLTARSSERFAYQAQMYRQQYEEAFARLRFTYDANEDGVVDDEERNRSARPVIALVSRGQQWRY